jgi:Leucine-rich repeat (LRR) protein
MASEDTDDAALDVEFEVVEEDWAMVESGELKGMKFEKGAFPSLSSESTRDIDRWQKMPSVEEYPSLKKLDLYKSRYIEHLHDSVCGLAHLEVLSLVRCENLKCLPEKIGNLENLQVLDLTDACELSSLPESIGDLSSLRKLTIGGHQGSGNKVLKTLPSTIVKLSCLETLCLDKCKELESLPPDIGNLMNLKELFMR